MHDDPHRPKLPRPTAHFSLQNCTGSLSFGNGNNPARPEERVDTRDVLLGADFGDRCHFSNLTRVKIERRQAVSWCDSTAVAEHRAAVAAALRLRENHAGMRRGRRHPLRAAQSRAALPQGRRQRPGPCPCGAETTGCEGQRRHVRCGQASAQPLAPCLLRAAGPRVPGPAPAPHGSEAQQGRGAPGGM